MQIFKQLVLEVQRFFPELIHRIYVVNAPMFFEGVWETQLMQSVHENTQKKVIISASESCDELEEDVDTHDLPQLYGGTCECQATCIYSEKGPWSEVENYINYKDPKPQSDSDEDDCNIDDRPNMNFKMNINAQLTNNQFGEEFKMHEDGDDQVDLL